MHCIHLVYILFLCTASFDVQNITVQSMGTEVNITGVFISNSQALGCFVVLQCNENNPDHFRVLLRNQLQNSVSSIIDAPSKEDTEYTIFVYDLEEKGLPYERPAIARGDKVFVNAKGKQIIGIHVYVHGFLYIYMYMHMCQM